jgi:transcriptional regulator with XRE-family HTH domain
MIANRNDAHAARIKKQKKRKTTSVNAKPGATAKNKSHRPTEEEPSMILQVASLIAKAFKLAAKTGDASLKIGKALLTSSAGDTKMMRETGEYLKDVRELAGLTRAELAEALNLSDQSILAAAEKGTATLSFELILRLAALLARHDPLPFIIKFTRTYDPEIWAILERWGIGRITVQLERERKFINIFRGNDAARKFSDAAFDEVLQFTRAAFDMALHFAEKQEKSNLLSAKERKDGKIGKRDLRKKR